MLLRDTETWQRSPDPRDGAAPAAAQKLIPMLLGLPNPRCWHVAWAVSSAVLLLSQLQLMLSRGSCRAEVLMKGNYDDDLVLIVY